MIYNSESIKDMISCLKKDGYEYTSYTHKNGTCDINTNILLKALEKQVVEENMHLVKLFIANTIETLIYTNASDYIIKTICKEIKEDGLLKDKDKINGVLEVLKARGYKYQTINDIPQFGFSKNEDFSKSYSEWIIAYCLDTNSFFATNQRAFFWEYKKKFQCEKDAITYFKNHLYEFKKIRDEILNNTGGWDIKSDLYLENTKESFEYNNITDLWS